MLKLAPKNYNPFACMDDDRIISGFSCRSFGNMSLSYGDTRGALDNRRGLLSALNIDYKDLICAKQIHGNSVKYVNEVNKGSGALAYDTSIPDTDGFITDTRNLPLAIFTADCLSIFLFDPHKPAVGLIHAGWRSSKETIVPNALSLMQSKFNTDPAELFAGFGPCIRDCCYEVSAEFKDYFSTDLTQTSGRTYLDLSQVNKKQLIDSGVKKDKIFDSGLCTSCENKDFFSYRREKDASGRMISVIMLK